MPTSRNDSRSERSYTLHVGELHDIEYISTHQHFQKFLRQLLRMPCNHASRCMSDGLLGSCNPSARTVINLNISYLLCHDRLYDCRRMNNPREMILTWHPVCTAHYLNMDVGRLHALKLAMELVTKKLQQQERSHAFSLGANAQETKALKTSAYNCQGTKSERQLWGNNVVKHQQNAWQ